MTRLNVRCCCQPTKILGTLEVPDHVARGGKFETIVSEAVELLRRDDRACLLDEMPAISIEKIVVRKISLCHISDEIKRDAIGRLPPESEYAVYSEERPIEFWRKVRGFLEGDAV